MTKYEVKVEGALLPEEVCMTFDMALIRAEEISQRLTRNGSFLRTFITRREQKDSTILCMFTRGRRADAKVCPSCNGTSTQSHTGWCGLCGCTGVVEVKK